MLKTKKFKTPIYGTSFTLIIYDDIQAMKKKFINMDFDNFDGAVFYYKDILYISFKRYKEKKVQYPTPGIIAHEAKHLVNNIFIEIHHELDRHNDEPECYLLGWVVNRIHENI